MWNPPTISCSASTRSKGARLVSATAAMKKIRNEGASTITFQAGTPTGQSRKVRVELWEATISEMRIEPVRSTTGTRDSPMAAS